MVGLQKKSSMAFNNIEQIVKRSQDLNGRQSTTIIDKLRNVLNEK